MFGKIFTYCLTYGGAGAAIFSPMVGLMIYVCFAIIRPQFLWRHALPAHNYSFIVAAAMVIGWLIHGTGSWTFGKAKWIVLSFIAYWGWMNVSMRMSAAQPDVSWDSIVLIAKIMLSFIVGVTLVTTLPRLKAMVWTIIVSTGFLCIEFNLTYIRGYNMVEAGFGSMGRAVLATGLVCALAFTVFLAIYETGWKRFICLGFAAAIAHAVLLSYSRGAMLGMIAAVSTAFIFVEKTPKHYFFLACAVAFVLFFSGERLQSRFSTIFLDAEDRDKSAAGRIELWRNCITLTKENPVFGVGPNHFPLNAERFGWPKGKEGHNHWLQASSELGVPGATFLFAFYGFSFWRAMRLSKVKPYNEAEAWCQMVGCAGVAALAAFFICSMFVTIEALEMPYYVALLVTAASRVLDTSREEDAEREDYDVGYDDGYGEFDDYDGDDYDEDDQDEDDYLEGEIIDDAEYDLADDDQAEEQDGSYA